MASRTPAGQATQLARSNKGASRFPALKRSDGNHTAFEGVDVARDDRLQGNQDAGGGKQRIS
ncbi:hypothetical protein CTT39_24170 [Agrobacterium rosae]|nr:hypothetical protein CTT39_24170 [Agrobacterium rosae]